MGEKTKKTPVRVTANIKRAVKIETDKKEETRKICPPLSQCSTVFRCRGRRGSVTGLHSAPHHQPIQRCCLCCLSPGMLHRHISLEEKEDTAVHIC